VTGHGGGAVVKDQHRGPAAAVDQVDQRGDPRVKKVESPITATVCPAESGSARSMPTAIPMPEAHADTGIERLQRRQRTQSVAADIAGHVDLQPAQCVEDATVWTARA